MKTKLQYPNGLSIIIEHEENIVPQLLEVKESDNALDIIGLQKKVDYLRRENKQLFELTLEWEKDNKKLNEALENIAIENNDNLATISALREELKSIFKEPITKIPTRHASPDSQDKFFKTIKWGKRPCKKCGKEFQATGPRSLICPECKGEKSTEPAE